MGGNADRELHKDLGLARRERLDVIGRYVSDGVFNKTEYAIVSIASTDDFRLAAAVRTIASEDYSTSKWEIPRYSIREPDGTIRNGLEQTFRSPPTAHDMRIFTNWVWLKCGLKSAPIQNGG
ncbi:hypothetical protein Poly51_59450 [Rubripirellula tenax]|uniref:Uncharacterized protein n=2 Tax=Rubripirellula tenax TaxID=2528015 RepID=A0A5C6EB05_9BACT|nr:hypothetical protein Poly51_59450 [Rubripirellula tenax]